MENNNCSECRLRASKDHVSVEIGDDPIGGLVSSIKERIENTSSLHCICRVPETPRMENEKAYGPEIVSIGPFHHGEPSLKEMEDHKWRYLYTLLSRKPSLENSSNLETRLDKCVKSLIELEHRARRCYGEDINLTSDAFVEMMLLDGCFIIELFLKYAIKGLRRRDDPIFSITGKFFNLRLNLILLENQIPFFVLQQLFNIVPLPRQCSQSLSELAFQFFKNLIPGNKEVFQEKFNQEGNHLLDLIHNCLLPTYQKVLPKKIGSQKRLDCATKLHEARISFRRARRESLLDIKFVNGVIEIPPLKIHHYTETLLRNLIALEQCYSVNCTPHITSYAFIMKSLVCSEKDVRLLHRKQILTNSLDSEKEDSEMFKKLCKDEDLIHLNNFFYEGLVEQVSEYKRSSWPLYVWWQKLMPKYQDQAPPALSPMVIFVAILLLVLILVGTLFSVLSFSLHRL